MVYDKLIVGAWQWNREQKTAIAQTVTIAYNFTKLFIPKTTRRI
jgi:hypothetical protein